MSNDIIVTSSPNLAHAGTFNGDLLSQKTNQTTTDGLHVVLITNSGLAQDRVTLGVTSFYLDRFYDIFFVDPLASTEVNLDTVLELDDPQFMLHKHGGK